MTQENFKKTAAILISLYFFLLPLFFLPQISSSMDFAKKIFALLFTALFLLFFSAKLAFEKEIKIKYSFLSLLFFIFALVALFSSLFSPNKIDSLFSVSPIIIAAFLNFFLLNILEKNGHLKFVLSMVVSCGVFVSLFVLLQEVNSRFGVINPLPNVSPSLDQIILNPGFSLLGSLVSQVFFLLCLFPLLFHLLKTANDPVRKNIALFVLILLILGMVISLKNFIQSKPVLLDYTTSWKVSVNTLGTNTKTALLGIGPGNFVTSLNLYKPVSFNQKSYWNVDFQNARSEVLNILSTLGLLGFFAFLAFALKLGLVSFREKNIFSLPPLLFLFLAVFFPVPAFVWLFFLPFLALLSLFFNDQKMLIIAQEKNLPGESVSSESSENAPFLPYIFLIIALLLSLILFFVIYHLTMAEYYINRSFRFTDASNVFTLQSRAVALYPYSETYHLTLSKTNLAIANALSAQKNLSAEDKQIALNHVQLALDEARRAINLNPEKRLNYEALADIYQSLSPGFKGAEDFALTGYTNALYLSPANPNLYVKRGGVFLQKNDLDNALKDFQNAINIKPDYANAYYNLSYAFEKKGQYQSALDQLGIASKIIPPNTPDAKKVTEDIKRLKDLIIASPSGTLAPQPVSDLKPSPTPTLASPEPALNGEGGSPSSPAPSSPTPTLASP